LLRMADKNQDGKLTRDEFVAGIEHKPEAAESAAKKPGRPKGRPGPEKIFRQLDANQDGKVTLDEVPEPRRERFREIIKRGDKDGDGGLSEEEFGQGMREALMGRPGAGKRPDGAPDPARLFRRMDKNGDGKLTLDEVPDERRPIFERMFKRLGKSEGEGLTPDEFGKVMRRIQPPGSAGASQQFSAPPRGGLFLALDTDHDGKLSSAEIAVSAEVLKKLDKKGDGAITIDELLPPDAESAGK
jgi:Ca2+-binding EF-hand superfamily protein